MGFNEMTEPLQLCIIMLLLRRIHRPTPCAKAAEWCLSPCRFSSPSLGLSHSYQAVGVAQQNRHADGCGFVRFRRKEETRIAENRAGDRML
jgi:hypothetical protein